jgi:hypothetical protein
MFRKHFRIRRRLFVGLAFAAFAVPAAPAAAASLSTFVDGGPAPVSIPASAYSENSYLRYHEVGGPLGAGLKTAATPLDIQFVNAIRASENQNQVVSENGRRVSTVTPLQADGLRWNAMADAYLRDRPTVAISERSNGVKGPDPSLVPQLISATSTGFDWSDAGIGASTAFGIALLLVTGVALSRRRDQGRLTSA